MILALAVSAALVGSAAAWTATTPRSGTDDATRPPSTIDLPAVDRVAPADAVVNVRTAYGAVGDGRADDTAALQAAISTGLGFGNSNKIIYLPAGTYRVTRPLEWRRADGTWDTFLTLMGQNRDRTVIRLDDGAAGFQDPADPRAVIVTGSQNSDATDGSGNQAFHNFVFDLTVDVGAANPGADGIDYLANNRGAIRNVVVRAASDSGHAGVSMNRKWPGPALLEDVRVTGFARGIDIGHGEYSMTAEDVRLSDQREVGIDNRGNVVALRGLVSDNAVPALRNGGPDATGGLVVLLDAHLTGGAPRAAAIETHGATLVRGMHTAGYAAPVRDGPGYRFPPDGGDWLSEAPSALFAGAGADLQLPLAEDPAPPDRPAGDWIGVGTFGARPDEDGDDTVAIQAALDAGKPVVHLRPGRYEVSGTLRVPHTVVAIMGFDATINAKRGAFAGESDAPVLRVDEPSTEPLVVAQLSFTASPRVVDVERATDRPIALRHIHFGGAPFRGSPGPLYLTDVAGGSGWRFTAGQEVWARQLNVEQKETKIVNTGAQLWVLGIKTESPSTVLDSSAGARTEILGGLLYPVGPVPEGTPAFHTVDSALALTVATTAYEKPRNYAVLVDATSGGAHRQLMSADVPRRGLGSVLTLATAPGRPPPR